jgi:hypothetical protein
MKQAAFWKGGLFVSVGIQVVFRRLHPRDALAGRTLGFEL